MTSINIEDFPIEIDSDFLSIVIDYYVMVTGLSGVQFGL